MNRLVVAVPLREGGYEAARRLLERGPPFDLEATRIRPPRGLPDAARGRLRLRDAAPGAALELPGEDRELWRVAAEWRNVMAGRPRTARTVYAWSRGDDAPGDDAA
jgi:hypothetical protein